MERNIIRNRLKYLLAGILVFMQLMQPLTVFARLDINSAMYTGFSKDAFTNLTGSDLVSVESELVEFPEGISMTQTTINIDVYMIDENCTTGITVNDSNALKYKNFFENLTEKQDELYSYLVEVCSHAEATGKYEPDYNELKMLYNGIYQEVFEQENWVGLQNYVSGFLDMPVDDWKNYYRDSEIEFWYEDKVGEWDGYFADVDTTAQFAEEVANALYGTENSYANTTNISCSKEGYELEGYWRTGQSWRSVNLGVGNIVINYSIITLEPIWSVPDVYVGYWKDFEVGDELPANSLIYRHPGAGQYLFFYADMTSYWEMLGTPALQSESMALTHYSNNAIIKIVDNYNGIPVSSWKIKSMCTSYEYRQNNNWVVSVNISNDWGNNIAAGALSTDPYAPTHSSQLNNTLFIELEPIIEKPGISNPIISMDAYELDVETVPPSSDGCSRDYTDITTVEDYVYITKDMDMTLEELEEGLANSTIHFTKWEDVTNKVLHEGEYRVFHYAEATVDYTDTQSEVIKTEVQYTDVKVEKPILDVADASIGGSEGNPYAEYTEGAVTSATNATDYSSIVDELKLTHLCVTDTGYDGTGFSQDAATGDFSETDSLVKGWNKVYTQASLTVPESMFGEPEVTYYSDIKEEILYVPYVIETPVITEGQNDVSIANTGPNAVSFGAKTKYVQTDYLNDPYANSTPEEVAAAAALYQNNLPKLDGISSTYAVTVHTETILGVEYSSYSGVAHEVVTKPYTVNNVVANYNSNNISLSTGGYSSSLKGYDTSTIYYIKTDTDQLTEEQLNNLISDANKYTGAIDKGGGDFYITAVEVVISDNGAGVVVQSKSNITTTYIPVKTNTPVNKPVTDTTNNNSNNVNSNTNSNTNDSINSNIESGSTPVTSEQTTLSRDAENVKTGDGLNRNVYAGIFVLGVVMVAIGCLCLYRKGFRFSNEEFDDLE